MALIIAVVLIVIVSCRVLGDKAGEWQYEADSKKLDASASKVKVYTDSQLEKIIWDSFEDETRLSEIHKELDLAIDQMEHWKNGWLGRKRSLCLHPSEYSFGSFKATKNRIKFRDDLIYYDRQTALSILLANRGKVSIAAERDGYYAGCVRINDNAPYLDYEHGDFRQNQKEQWFELVEWIRSTLDKQGVHLTPVCTKKSTEMYAMYGWLGSGRAPEDKGNRLNSVVYKPFDHRLIEEPTLAPIPAPYYARLAQVDNDKQELMTKRLQLISCLRAVQESKLGEEMGSVM